jgi:hypothetical protein
MTREPWFALLNAAIAIVAISAAALRPAANRWLRLAMLLLGLNFALVAVQYVLPTIGDFYAFLVFRVVIVVLAVVCAILSITSARRSAK